MARDLLLSFQMMMHLSIFLNISRECAFSCLACALNPKLQAGNSIPKQEARVNLHRCAGKSTFYAGNTSLVMNSNARMISPQFYLVFDDSFTTVDILCNITSPTN